MKSIDSYILEHFWKDTKYENLCRQVFAVLPEHPSLTSLSDCLMSMKTTTKSIPNLNAFKSIDNYYGLTVKIDELISMGSEIPTELQDKRDEAYKTMRRIMTISKFEDLYHFDSFQLALVISLVDENIINGSARRNIMSAFKWDLHEGKINERDVKMFKLFISKVEKNLNSREKEELKTIKNNYATKQKDLANLDIG